MIESSAGHPEPFVVTIVMCDGDPSGLKLIEKSNWSGAGLEVPRPLLSTALKREELKRPGVYVLVGETAESELPMVYVGEGDEVGARLTEHSKSKDFWTHAILFTSSANRLNKAHVRFLESSLVSMAIAAKRCDLRNNVNPRIPPLSEGDSAEVQGFLGNMLQLLGVLGYEYFEKPAGPQSGQREFSVQGKGIDARGYESTGGFVVREGSGATLEEVDSISRYLRDMRSILVETGILKRDADHLVFTQDYEFASPSTASGCVLGRSSNGRIDWKTGSGETLKDVQDVEADSVG